MSWKNPIQPKSDIPSFNDVMEEDKIPSFGEVMGEKKSGGENGLQQSAPTTSPSPENNFGANLPSVSDIVKGQRNVADATILPKNETVENLGFQKAHEKELQERNLKVRNQAIDNTVQRSLKLKGINAQPNSLLYNIEKSTYTQQLDDGNAVIGVKDGKPGLNKTIGNWDSFHSHMMEAINENKDAREFKDMTPSERVDYAHKLQDEQNNTEYIGEKSKTKLGSVLATGGSALPTLGLYAAGAMAGGVLESLAPATGGLSQLALKPVMSFVMNEGTEANKSGMQGTLGRYNAIIQQHPEMDKVEAMKKATEGEDVDRLAGIAQAGLFSQTGRILGKSVAKTFIKDALRTGVDVGVKTGVVEGAKDVGHNIEGVTNKSAGEILKDMGIAFAENAPVGTALHAFMGVLTKVANVGNLVKSGLKYDVVTKITPPEITSELDKNVQSGAITSDEANKAESDLNSFRQTVSSLPDELPDEVKASVAGLIEKKKSIDETAQQKDQSPPIQQAYSDLKSSIDSQVGNILKTGNPLDYEIDEATGKTYTEQANEIPEPNPPAQSTVVADEKPSLEKSLKVGDNFNFGETKNAKVESTKKRGDVLFIYTDKGMFTVQLGTNSERIALEQNGLAEPTAYKGVPKTEPAPESKQIEVSEPTNKTAIVGEKAEPVIPEDHPEIKKLMDERDEKIKEANKPDITFEKINNKDLIKNPDTAIENKTRYKEIIKNYSLLKQLVDCL